MKKFFLVMIFSLFVYSLFSQTVEQPALPEQHRNFQITYYKKWQENEFRADEFSEPVQPNQRQEFMHFRVTRDANAKLLSVAFYYKNFKIAPYVNNDKIWFHFIKYYYDDKNRLNKKVFYRETGEPQGQYLFEYDNQNRLIKIERQTHNLNPNRENEYLPNYFVLFDYHPNGKTRVQGRFDKYANPQEKLIFDEQGRVLRYERFFANTSILNYYLTFQYNAQNQVSVQTVYNIDGVMIEVPGTTEQRQYQDLIRTRYPQPGRRGPINENNETSNAPQGAGGQQPGAPAGNTNPPANR